MDYNLSYKEVLLRYFLMMIIVITGGLLHSLPIMLIGLPFFLTGVLGWCPLYTMFGINHAIKSNH
jgi:hypothetical protein